MKLLNKKLRVRNSQLPNSGKGLFTTVNIAKGQHIIEYAGSKFKVEEVVKIDIDNDNLYMHNGLFIDGTGNLAARMNDANGICKKRGCSNNCEFFQPKKSKKVFIIATRDILFGEELFVDYSKDYWSVQVQGYL